MAVPSGMPSMRRRFGQRQLEVVVKDDDRPVLGRETGKDPVDLVAIRDRLGFVGCRGVKDGVDLDLDRSPAAGSAPDRCRLGR